MNDEMPAIDAGSPGLPRRIVKIIRGHRIKLSWVHDGSGYSSRTAFTLASYHHPDSVTWRWVLYWQRGRGWKPAVHFWTPNKGKSGSCGVELPIIGGLMFCWQQHMWYRDALTTRTIHDDEQSNK